MFEIQVFIQVSNNDQLITPALYFRPKKILENIRDTWNYLEHLILCHFRFKNERFSCVSFQCLTLYSYLKIKMFYSLIHRFYVGPPCLQYKMNYTFLHINEIMQKCPLLSIKLLFCVFSFAMFNISWCKLRMFRSIKWKWNRFQRGIFLFDTV